MRFKPVQRGRCVYNTIDGGIVLLNTPESLFYVLDCLRASELSGLSPRLKFTVLVCQYR